MFIQPEFLRDGDAMTLANTYRLILPETGLLTSLDLQIWGDNGGSYGLTGGDWRVVDKITKVEILLNASTVCKSLTGKQIQAMQFFDTRVFPACRWRNYASESQQDLFSIFFGRKFGDMQYGLDLSKYASVELRITNNSTSSDLSAFRLSVIGNFMRDLGQASFQGYMRTEEWKNWTTVQAATEYSNLPTEYPIRRVVLQAKPSVDSTTKMEDTNFTNLMYNVNCSYKTGQVRVFDGGLDDLMFQNQQRYGYVQIGMQPYVNADKAFETGCGWNLGYSNGAGARDGAAATTVPTIASAETKGMLNPETYQGDHPMNLLVSGLAPHGCVVLPFDWSDDPASWLDPEAQRVVKLDIKTRDSSSAASGTNRIILDRLVRNA